MECCSFLIIQAEQGTGIMEHHPYVIGNNVLIIQAEQGTGIMEHHPYVIGNNVLIIQQNKDQELWNTIHM
jgi:hypothetical protein